MKKIFFTIFLSLLINHTYAQDNLYNSNIFTDSPILLSSGHFGFDIPLFNLETSNQGLNLDGQLNYHSKSVRAIYSGSPFGNGFSFNLSPVVSRQAATDETKLPSLYVGANGINTTPDVYSYNMFGLTGKFFIYVHNGFLKTQIIEQNKYAEISIKHQNSNGSAIGVNSYENSYFDIIDENGNVYTFSTKEIRNVSLNTGGTRPIRTVQNRPLNIYLTKVTDKTGREILAFSYKDRINQEVTLKDINEIVINNYGKLKFNYLANTTPTVQSIDIYNDFNAIIKSIVFSYESTYSNTYNLSKLTFKDINNKSFYYQFYYESISGTLGADGFFWGPTPLYTDMPYGVSTSSEFSIPQTLSKMTNGTLIRMIKPTGGFVDFEYEPNEVNLEDNDLYNENLNNYSLKETLKSISTVNKRTNLLITPYKRITFTIPEKSILHYKFQSPGVTTPGVVDIWGNPKTTYPTYNIYKPNVSQPLVTGVANTSAYKYITLEPGVYYLDYLSSEATGSDNISLKTHTKKTTDLEYFTYAPGIRIKSIKEHHRFSGKDYKETIFHYKSMSDLNEKKSSGYYGKYGKIDRSTMVSLKNKDKNFEFVFYKDVVKEIKGRGYIEYNFGDKIINDSLITIGKNDILRNYPKKIKNYDLNKILSEEAEINYTFSDINSEIDESNISVKKQKVLSSKNTILKNYINNQNILQANINTLYSTEYYHPVLDIFEDIKNNETARIESQYQKLGKEILLINQRNIKNESLINEIKNNYVQQSINPNISFYNLSSANNVNVFGELTNRIEVTKTDERGNILEHKDLLGIYHSTVWGYNQSKILFTIPNMRYNEINQSIITTLSSVTSNNLASNYRQKGFIIQKYNELRSAHPDKLITSYTYNIGLGTETVTDPNGKTTHYNYDAFGRLINIVDSEGKLVKKYEYNYKFGVN